jgi:hypothetical protein
MGTLENFKCLSHLWGTKYVYTGEVPHRVAPMHYLAPKVLHWTDPYRVIGTPCMNICEFAATNSTARAATTCCQQTLQPAHDQQQGEERKRNVKG